MNRRYSAYQRTRTNTQFGGTYADSLMYSTAFRKNSVPLNLGVKDVEIFSKQVNGQLLNKPMTYRTGKNMVELLAQHGGKVTWTLGTTGTPRARIVDIDPNLGSYPGQAGTKFRIALDVPFYHEPVLFKTETTNAPRLRVLGYPQTESTDKHWYEVELQTGNMTDYCPVEDLQIGKTVKDAGTSVANELNDKRAGLEFGSTSDWGSQISYFGRKFEVTDRTIRMELDARNGKGSFSGVNVGGTHLSSIVGSGYVISKAGQKEEQYLKEGQFLSNIEMLLRDRIYQDRECDMYDGKIQTSFDPDSSYQRLNGSGWFETSQEGNYSTHDGQNVTLAEMINPVAALKFNQDDPKGSVVEFETGTAGMRLANYLISLEAATLPFTLSTNYFIDEAPSNFTNDGLAMGFQFVEFRQFGRIYRFVWNPNMDDLDMFPKQDPETGFPLESESFNIFDLGSSKDALGNKQNLAMAYEPSAFAWWTQSSVCNFSTGNLKAGEISPGGNIKEAGVHMEINGSMVVFDVSRTWRKQRV